MAIILQSDKNLSNERVAEIYLIPPGLVANFTVEEPRLVLVHLDVAVLTPSASSSLGLCKGFSGKSSSSASTTIRRLIRPLDLIFIFILVLVAASVTDRGRDLITLGA